MNSVGIASPNRDNKNYLSKWEFPEYSPRMLLLRSIVASLWPQEMLRWWHPGEPRALVHGAAISGAIEFVLFGFLELLQFEKHFVANAQHFSAGNESTQLIAVVAVIVAELFYPLSFVLILMAVEGFLRAVAAGFVGQVVPSLPVTVAARLWMRTHRAADGLASR